MTFPWLEIARQAVEKWRTPLYVFALGPVLAAYDELKPLGDLPVWVRHWYSLKTQPVRPLLVAWHERTGNGCEVVSLLELMAAREAGFRNEEIVVNGLAKHAWLPSDAAGLRVHIDSPGELEALGAERLRSCRLGARCHILLGPDPNDPTIGGQFGMDAAELAKAASVLRSIGRQFEGVHFHLHSNIRKPETYLGAVETALSMAREAGIEPSYVDFGGGFPVPGEATLEPGGLRNDELSIPELVSGLRAVLDRNRSVVQLWFENGRFVTSRAGILVLRILDVKERGSCRFLLCDGGRTNNALPADWQPNALATLPARSGPPATTVLCGPTCTAYDRIGPRQLPSDLTVGDHVVWFNAGAYHLSWQTKFSQGFANVVWCDGEMRLSLARPADDFATWWGPWA